MKNLIILVFTTIILTSCENNEKPKVIYPQNGKIETLELKKDSTLIEIADLPIHIDSTKYLIHPIGEYEIYNYRGSSSSSSGYFSSSSYGSGSFDVSRLNSYEITGNLYNLKFENITVTAKAQEWLTYTQDWEGEKVRWGGYDASFGNLAV